MGFFRFCMLKSQTAEKRLCVSCKEALSSQEMSLVIIFHEPDGDFTSQNKRDLRAAFKYFQGRQGIIEPCVGSSMGTWPWNPFHGRLSQVPFFVLHSQLIT